MKVAKNNTNITVNTNSKEWKYIVYDKVNGSSSVMHKAKTLKRAVKKLGFCCKNYVLDELIFLNELEEKTTLNECKAGRFIIDKNGKEWALPQYGASGILARLQKQGLI